MKKAFIIEEIPVKKTKEKYKGSDKEKIVIIDTILSMYPQLKRDRTLIINSVLGKVEKSSTVLEKFVHGDDFYYRDDDGKIFDVDVKLRGCYIVDPVTKRYKYYIFPESELVNELNEVKGMTSKMTSKMANRI